VLGPAAVPQQRVRKLNGPEGGVRLGRRAAQQAPGGPAQQAASEQRFDPVGQRAVDHGKGPCPAA
jgi:hypothetical protein